MNVVMKYLDRLDEAEATRVESLKAAYEVELMAHDGLKKSIESDMRKVASSKGKDDRLAAAKHNLAMLIPPEEPHQRRYKSNELPWKNSATCW
jgi:hypothetical protein